MTMFEKMISKLYLLPILVREQSVTRAAKRMYVTQAAMSQLLRDLRLYLKDPLLVRQGNKMVPTDRAIKLSFMIERMFGQLRECVDTYFEELEASEQKEAPSKVITS